MAASNPLLAIERLLEGKTTLKTQRATHSNIIYKQACRPVLAHQDGLSIGTELLNHIQAIMSEDKEKAIKKAVTEAEKKANAKLRNEVELVTQILEEENKMKLRQLSKDHKNEIMDLRRKWKLEEEARAKEVYDRYEFEKEAAVNEAMEREQKQRNEFVEKKIKSIVKELSEEARKEKEKELSEQRRMLHEEALKEQELAISETKKECNKAKELKMNKMKKEFNEEIEELMKRIDYMNKMLEIEMKRKEELQQTFMELKEDYKRFQNYTGRFHSDYLLS